MPYQEKQTKDILYLTKGNSMFLGLDFDTIYWLYRDYCSAIASDSTGLGYAWLVPNEAIKGDFIRWCNVSPIQNARNQHGTLKSAEINSSVMSPEQAKLQLQESLKVRLQKDIELFNKELNNSVHNGDGQFWVNLPSLERVKQLAEFVNSKGYKVKAVQGLTDYYIQVQL